MSKRKGRGKTLKDFWLQVSAGVMVTLLTGWWKRELISKVASSVFEWLAGQFTAIVGWLTTGHKVVGWLLLLLALAGIKWVVGVVRFLWARLVARAEALPSTPQDPPEYVRDEWFGCIWTWRNRYPYFGLEIRGVCPKCSHTLSFRPLWGSQGRCEAWCPDETCDFSTVLPCETHDVDSRIHQKIEQGMRHRGLLN